MVFFILILKRLQMVAARGRGSSGGEVGGAFSCLMRSVSDGGGGIRGCLSVPFRHVACGRCHIIQLDQLAPAAAVIHWEQLAEKLYRFPDCVYPQCNWGLQLSSRL